MGLTRVGGDILQTPLNVGVVTATTINVGTAVTIHTGGFRVGSSDLHSSGLTVQNLNSTGVVTATSFVGNISGNVTGNATGLSGTPNITVGNIIASSATISGNVSVAGTVTYDDVTNVDSLGVGTFRSGIVVNTGTASTALIVNGSSRITGILSVGQGTITINGNTDKITTPKLDYAGISSVTADNAVDVFVYDTRKDSDGGAWRKRTQHTSWYNETLNTATRGSRRDFPAVAVIVCKDYGFTIYDGDDPDLPMWASYTYVSWDEDVNSIVARDGKICFTIHTNSGYSGNGFGIFDYIKDRQSRNYSGGYANFKNGFVNNLISSNRSTANYLETGDNVREFTLVNYNCNDVAMTVLPNAPIDSITGLPVPTIAVATNGGFSVIKDDETVINKVVSGTVTNKVDWYKNIYLLGTGPEYWALYKDLSAESGGYISDTADLYSAPNQSGWDKPQPSSLETRVAGANDLIVGAGSGGITLKQPPLSLSNGTTSLLCGITSSYNTGWMHGDIKGAFLSDTSTASVTGTELITNGTFTSNTTGWSISDGSGTVTISSVSGQLNIVMNNNLNGYRWAFQTISNLPAGSYAISADVVSNPSNRARIRVGTTGANTTDLVDSGYLTGTGTFSVYFTTTSTQNVTLTLMSDLQTGTGVWDNVVFRKVEADRSVNNKGLAVYGTITKTAVATGADLVAYSGFNSSNGLIQPYNSALDFGTGDYYMSIWAYGGGDGQVLMVREHGTSDADGSILLFQQSNSYAFYSRQDGTSSWTSTLSSTGYGSRWNHVTMVRTGGILYGYVNGKLETSIAFSGNVTNNDATLNIGRRNPSVTTQYFTGQLALAKIGAGAPSPDQIKKIYNDEKMLFQDNSKATLYGTSSAVTALAYDDSTRLLYAGTSSGRSDFQGLERINNTTTAVTTAISASNGLVAEQ